MDQLGGSRWGGDPDENRVAWFVDGHLQRRIELYAWDMSQTSVSYGYPLLDRDLVEWCLRVPAEMWMSSGVHRSLFREAIATRVPGVVAQRPRKNEPDPTRRGRAGERRKQIMGTLAANAVHPLVHRYLPHLGKGDLDAVDMVGLTHLELVTNFLADQHLSHLH
jgi:hypothetical protein